MKRSLDQAGLVSRTTRIDPSRFLELMAADKKVAAGRIRLVLLRALGEAVVSAEFPPEELQALLRDNLRAAAAASSS